MDVKTVYSVSLPGQQLWVLALGESPHRHTVGIPEFKYVANMHGNEVNTHPHTHTQNSLSTAVCRDVYLSEWLLLISLVSLPVDREGSCVCVSVCL